MSYEYITNFEKLGFGLFVHFGLFSMLEQGEWYLESNPNPDKEKYAHLHETFNVSKNWAKELVQTAKKAGCKYITLTTRHHDGFSLYDTKGLSDYDIMHSKTNRDLIKEYTDECHKAGIVPFFYHTLLDWHHPSYETNFPDYIDYLANSIETLCKNYGKIGGFWFDGMWNKPDADWQEDRIYGIIRKYQPDAMIINNTGLSECGKVGHPELDSVTFERGKPAFVDNSDRPRAGEMCQVLNDHWGYAKNDFNYKPVKELIENLIDCRKYNCNFLLNTGLMGNGKIAPIDKAMLETVGGWVKSNKNFIYNIKGTDLKAENVDIVYDGKYYYAIIKDVGMEANPNVQREGAPKRIITIEGKKIKSAVWLDNGEKIEIQNNSFREKAFYYGTSGAVRVAKLILK